MDVDVANAVMVASPIVVNLGYLRHWSFVREHIQSVNDALAGCLRDLHSMTMVMINYWSQ
jgi:hypothetical protein